RNGKCRQRNDALTAAPPRGADEQRQNKDPTQSNGRRQRDAEVGGEFERGAMGRVQYAPEGRFRASVTRKTPDEGSKTSAEPRVIGDHVQGCAIGVEAPFISKALRIEPPVYRSTQDLHQKKHHGTSAGHQQRQTLSLGKVTPKEHREC